MGYKQNNPLPMMKSALKMEKEMRKSGMHRNSAMYMGHESPAEMGHSPMEMGHESPAKKYDSPAMESRELKDMPIVDIEKGKAKGSPAKNMDHDKMGKKEKFNHMMVEHPAKRPDFTKKGEEEKKPGSPAKMGHDKNDDSPANHYFDPMHKQHKDDHKPKKKGSPAKAAKPDYIDIDGDGNKEESMKEAAKDKKGSPANMKRGSKDEKSGEQPTKVEAPKYDPKKRKEHFEKKKGSPAKKYDRVVLGGNKGDKSKTKPGKKDYEK